MKKIVKIQILQKIKIKNPKIKIKSKINIINQNNINSHANTDKIKKY